MVVHFASGYITMVTYAAQLNDGYIDVDKPIHLCIHTAGNFFASFPSCLWLQLATVAFDCLSGADTTTFTNKLIARLGKLGLTEQPLITTVGTLLMHDCIC